MKLRKWVKVVLFILFVYVIISMFTVKEVVKEEGKDYICYGSKILQVCAGKDYD